MSEVPELEPHCGSWVVTRKVSGKIVGEFFLRSNVEKFDPQFYLIETAAKYLARINSEVR